LFATKITVLFSLFIHSVLVACHGQNQVGTNVVIDAQGAIIRGNVSEKKIALVFTGHEFADGGETIRVALKEHKIQAGFFFTGDFYLNAQFASLVNALKSDGHYLGAHSDKHLLYADWKQRDSTLVTKKEFQEDLLDNYKRMAAYGIQKKDARYFLPPFEWYNKAIAGWTTEMQLQLINFTPGTRSTADYTFPEMAERYVSSDKIFQSILEHEQKDEHGLNGFILLIHIGSDPRRTDKFYLRLDSLIVELKTRGYEFVRINKLLDDK
jgi:peptidoglycan/xylan/chitin deacetylase (PgdA/CDA1 family)